MQIRDRRFGLFQHCAWRFAHRSILTSTEHPVPSNEKKIQSFAPGSSQVRCGFGFVSVLGTGYSQLALLAGAGGRDDQAAGDFSLTVGFFLRVNEIESTFVRGSSLGQCRCQGAVGAAYFLILLEG